MYLAILLSVATISGDLVFLSEVWLQLTVIGASHCPQDRVLISPVSHSVTLSHFALIETDLLDAACHGHGGAAQNMTTTTATECSGITSAC